MFTVMVSNVIITSMLISLLGNLLCGVTAAIDVSLGIYLSLKLLGCRARLRLHDG